MSYYLQHVLYKSYVGDTNSYVHATYEVVQVRMRWKFLRLE